MHIRHEDGARIMTEPIVCPNYFNLGLKHFDNSFEKLNDYTYQCKTCGEVMTITRRPIVVHDAYGRLKVQVVTEPKQEAENQ